ncbi:MAG: peptide chain release factor N(5)-glutamine methyltransferase [Hyphomicrobiales bacterium]|nr:peptide chain release factor N(5)-glutamine methyltransferase [Hyphomicrobiales bacterium]
MASPQREARALLCAALALDHAALLRDPAVTLGADVQRVQDWALRRAAGEPLSRIRGMRAFWCFDFAVNGAVLDPRPESETLIDAALALGLERKAPLRMADLGTGSGALLAALLHEWPCATGTAIDSSAPACAMAAANLAQLGFAERAQVMCGDWRDVVGQEFDLVVTNPPYIRSADIASLAVDVREHDPAAALDGGADGLDAYRAIMAFLPQILAPRGFAIIELGQGQCADVGALAKARGLQVIAVRADLAGIDRALVVGQADARESVKLLGE